jgi:carboxynorspermidine decarboxylase
MYIERVPSPCYVCEEELLEKNLLILDRVMRESGAKILCALKGFAMWSTFDIVAKYLNGACASGLIEAKLAREKLNKEVHTYSPAFKESEIGEIIELSDHIVFNSFSQWRKFKPYIKKSNKKIECGIRVNPEYSEIETELYNPCAINSRLGTTVANFDETLLEGIDGLHFHTHCEQNSDALKRGLIHFEEKFGKYIPQMKWINFGGGHHITREDYDVDLLIEIIKDFKSRYNDITVYLEPGEAVGWQTGVLVATVLDVVNNNMDIAILDTSAEAHMPDTLAMPYRAMIRDSGFANEKRYTYRFAGNTCLAGDIIGDYSFDKPLKIGDRVVFEDQIHYTMVKNTTFNGIKLPSIDIYRKNGKLDVVKNFGYDDYMNRLS